jgi:hypothetical protein
MLLQLGVGKDPQNPTQLPDPSHRPPAREINYGRIRILFLFIFFGFRVVHEFYDFGQLDTTRPARPNNYTMFLKKTNLTHTPKPTHPPAHPFLFLFFPLSPLSLSLSLSYFPYPQTLATAPPCHPIQPRRRLTISPSFANHRLSILSTRSHSQICRRRRRLQLDLTLDLISHSHSHSQVFPLP